MYNTINAINTKRYIYTKQNYNSFNLVKRVNLEDKAAAEQAAKMVAKQEQAALNKAAAEQAAKNKAVAEQAVLNKAAAEQAAKNKVAAEQAALDNEAAAEHVALDNEAAKKKAELKAKLAMLEKIKIESNNILKSLEK